MVGWSLDDANFSDFTLNCNDITGDRSPVKVPVTSAGKSRVMGVPRPLRGGFSTDGVRSSARLPGSSVAEAADSSSLVCRQSPGNSPQAERGEMENFCAWAGPSAQGCSPLFSPDSRFDDSPCRVLSSPLTREATSRPAPAATSDRTSGSQSLRTLRSSMNDPVGGLPHGSGEICLLDESLGKLVTCTGLVFSTGLYLVERSTGQVHNLSWSPFSVLLPSDGRFSSVPTDVDAPYASFAISIPTRGRHVLLVCKGSDAAAQKDKWTKNMSTALRSHIQAAFPRFTHSVEPLPGIPATACRILAGYLLLREDDHACASVPYCELQAYCKGFARLAFYSSELCESQLLALAISAKTRIFERSGIDCSCFAVDGHSFCARSVEERQIWIRAISNIKVKLQHGAPDPSPEELRQFRVAVRERILELEISETGDAAPLMPTPVPGSRSLGSQVNEQDEATNVLEVTKCPSSPQKMPHLAASPAAPSPLLAPSSPTKPALHEIVGEAWAMAPSSDSSSSDSMSTPKNLIRERSCLSGGSLDAADQPEVEECTPIRSPLDIVAQEVHQGESARPPPSDEAVSSDGYVLPRESALRLAEAAVARHFDEFPDFDSDVFEPVASL
eukprot:TRINITY_DN24939_c0_g1_i1.p1 TRINITY_DN24939_c0_g1~~TRINITY_DN24939_c0_g1_i1.p1  ORF type:complete len:615 (-),score=93.74 TRINITY_DN24939_c0_g1_i1:5-1849(-)